MHSYACVTLLFVQKAHKTRLAVNRFVCSRCQMIINFSVPLWSPSEYLAIKGLRIVSIATKYFLGSFSRCLSTVTIKYVYVCSLLYYQKIILSKYMPWCTIMPVAFEGLHVDIQFVGEPEQHWMYCLCTDLATFSYITVQKQGVEDYINTFQNALKSVLCSLY